MKKEAKLLLEKSLNSPVESIARFNGPIENGRSTTSLILIDHSFEMFLKAAIIHKGGKIREKRASETIGFDKCVRKALSGKQLQFLNEEQALTLQTINGLRDAAQHYLVDISEEQLYMQMQAGVTLYRDLLKTVFEKELAEWLPQRVLPISVKPLTSIDVMFENEIGEIKKLLTPGLRKKTEARSRIKPLAILDMNIRGEKGQPSDAKLDRICRRLSDGEKWSAVFSGVSSIQLNAEGEGTAVSLRFSKKEGIPIHVLPENAGGGSVVGIKRVNELDYYSLSRNKIAEKIGFTGPKTSAVIWKLKVQDNDDYYEEINIGKSRFQRYSPKGLKYIKEQLPKLDINKVWQEYREHIKTNKKGKR
jgi:hypothetical protein